MYDRKLQEFRSKQEGIKTRLGNLEKADDEYYQLATAILTLTQNASTIFESSELEVRRQLLKVLLQNCVVNATTLYPTHRSPFHLFAEGARCNEWLRSFAAGRNDRTQTIRLLIPVYRRRKKGFVFSFGRPFPPEPTKPPPPPPKNIVAEAFPPKDGSASG